MKVNKIILGSMISFLTMNLYAQEITTDKFGRVGFEERETGKKQTTFKKSSGSSISESPVLMPSEVFKGGDDWSGLSYRVGSVLNSAGDINGDGKTDLIEFKSRVPIISTTDLEDYHIWQYDVYLNDLSTASQTFTNLITVWPTGDIDNDGFTDAIVREISEDNKYKIYFGSASGYTASQIGFDYSGTNYVNWKSGDFDHDGVTDVVLLNAEGRDFYLLKGNSVRTSISLTMVSNSANTYWMKAFHRNSDSKDYLIRTIDNGGNLLIQLGSISSSFEWVVSQEISKDISVGNGSTMDVADLDGNGEVDLVFFNPLSYISSSTETLFDGVLMVPTVAEGLQLTSIRSVGNINSSSDDDLVFKHINNTYVISGQDIADGITESDFVELTNLNVNNGSTVYLQNANNNQNPKFPKASFGNVDGSTNSDIIASKLSSDQKNWDVSTYSDIESTSNLTVTNLNAPVRDSKEEYFYADNAGDWDNDGIDDFGYIYNVFNNIESRYFIDLSSGGKLEFNFGDFIFFGTPGFADLNGDGHPEMLIQIRRMEEGVQVRYFEVYSATSETSVFSEEVDVLMNSKDRNLSTFHSVSDVTGDGKEDVIVTSNAGAFLISQNGEGFQFNTVNAYANTGVHLEDLNGDGINDFAVTDFYSSGVKVIHGVQNPSSDYVFDAYQTIDYSNVAGFTVDQVTAFGLRLASGDFTGDGMMDLVIGSFQSRGAQNGSFLLWLFEGMPNGEFGDASKAFEFKDRDFDPFNILVDGGSNVYQIGLIQTLKDISRDGSDELLVTTFGSFGLTNAKILMGATRINGQVIPNLDFGDKSVLLEAPNRFVGLGMPGNLINATYNVAFGDFDNNNIPELILPQYADENFKSTPLYKYEVSIASPIEIASIEDVQNDQGGWVRINVDGSMFGPEFENYRPDWTIWRRSNPEQGWVHVSTIPFVMNGARYAEVAIPLTVPTGENPTNENSYEFMVSALAGRFESNRVRGWSMDNIAPSPVLGLAGKSLVSEVEFTWSPSIASDLKDYVLYRVNAGTIDLENPIATTTSTSLVVDKSELSGTEIEFVVLAYDVNNNASEASNAVNLDISTAIGDEELGLPTKVGLTQNFPNPFNPSTTINFELPQNSNVNLVVYDMLGRSVATLVNEPMSAGYHTVQFDASKLASGMYIYTLRTAEGVTISKRMSLIK